MGWFLSHQGDSSVTFLPRLPLCLLFFFNKHRGWSFEHHEGKATLFYVLHCSHIYIQPFIFVRVCYGGKSSASVTASHKTCVPSVERKVIYRTYFLLLKGEERRLFLSLWKITLQWGLEFLSNDPHQLCYSKIGAGSCTWALEEDFSTRVLKIKYFCFPAGQLHYRCNLVTQNF